MKVTSGGPFALQSLFFDVAARNVRFSGRARSHGRAMPYLQEIPTRNDRVASRRRSRAEPWSKP